MGEVGLDFSTEGKSTARRQELESFERVYLLGTSPKFVSVHSRRAETNLLDVLARHNVTGVVFPLVFGQSGGARTGNRGWPLSIDKSCNDSVL